MANDMKTRVEQRLKAKGLDMKAASLAAGMGETFVRDILRRDRVPRADAMHRLAIVLETTPEWLLTGEGGLELTVQSEDEFANLLKKSFRPQSNAGAPVPVAYPTERIPIFGSAVAGEDGKFVLNGQRIMDALCPPQLANVPNAYGVIVHSTSMIPRYFPGEGVFVNPHLPVLQNDFVIAQIAGDFEGDDPAGFVKQFRSMNSRELVLSQFQPREGVDEDAPEDERFTMRFPRDRVIAVHKIVSSGIV